MKESLRELGYILKRPADGFNEMKHKKTGSVKLAAFSVALWFFATLIEQQYTHFRFNEQDTLDTNVLFVLLGTVMMFLCFVISNWSVCTLFNGEGSFREIFIVTGYALIPYSAAILLSTLLSHMLGTAEGVFIQVLMAVGMLYAGLLLVAGLMQIHDYTISSTLMSVLVTLVGLLLIVFLGFLVITLFSQLYSFIASVVRECLMRGLR